MDLMTMRLFLLSEFEIVVCSEYIRFIKKNRSGFPITFEITRGTNVLAPEGVRPSSCECHVVHSRFRGCNSLGSVSLWSH